MITALREWYQEHKAARVISKALAAVALADPAQAAFDAFVGTQTVAPAEAGTSVEIFAHDQGILGEVKTGAVADEVPGSPTYFMRARVSSDYDGNTGNFMLNELSIGDVAGIRALGQVRLVGPNLVPIVGVSRVTKLGDLGTLYSALRANLGETKLGELHLIGTVPLGSFQVELENLLLATPDSAQLITRGHLGYKLVDDISLGIAGEGDFGTSIPTDYRAGVFIRLTN